MQAALDQDADRRVAVLTDHINRTASLLEQCAAEPVDTAAAPARRARLNKVVNIPVAVAEQVSVETDGAAGRRLLQSPRGDERFAARAATGSTGST